MTLSIAYRYEVSQNDVIAVAFDGGLGDRALADAYDAAFAQAEGLDSAAVVIDSGMLYGYPPRVSFEIAYARAKAWLASHDVDLTLVVPSRGVVEAPGEVARAVEAMWPQPAGGAPAGAARAAMPPQADGRMAARKPAKKRFSLPGFKSRRAAEDLCEAAEVAAPAGVPDDLQAQLAHLDASFSETLLALIDARGLTDAQVYKRANISRQHFSKIRGDATYRPKKQTVLAFAVALELTYGEAKTLLQRAGYTFSPSSPFDVIVGYYLERGIYDVFEINKALFAYDQQLLGSV